jgi:cell division protein FtsI (penicillin-binding protein 3)
VSDSSRTRTAGARSHGTRTHGRTTSGRTTSARTSAGRTAAPRTPTAHRSPQPSRPTTRSAPAVKKAPPARSSAALRAKRAPRRRTPGFQMTFRAGDTRKRMQFVFVLTALLFLAVIARVAILQTVGSDSLVEAGRAQRVSESVLHAQRGTIFARDGGELAISVPSATVFANPKLVVDPEATVKVLATMLGLDAEKQQKLLASFAAKNKSFVYVARQIDDSTADAVMALNLAGIDTVREDKRTMPSGAVGRSILGRTDIDGTGTAGLELQYDEILTGTDGERVREHDAKGRSIPGSGATTIEPIPGEDLVLTLDRSLQFQVEQALLTRVDEVKGKGGTVVVMDTATGEIYAVANVARDEATQTLAVTSANLAVVEPFEPGSVAKVFSLSAVLDQGAANPDTVITVPGKKTFDEGTQWEQTIRDAEPHGDIPMSMREILVHSSNLGTYFLANRIGSEQLANYLDKFGFGHATALNFPGETKGIIDPASEWQGTENVTVTYGYHYQASAVQFTAAINAVANGGTFVAPKLLKGTIGADGTVRETAPSDTHPVISSAAAAAMTSMMTDVVCEGTGKEAQVPGISVAGKTGTAYKTQDGGGYGDKNNRKYRASFAGFFPADDPKVTILVTIDEPDPTSADRFGGKAAAPLFAKVATAAIHELTIAPSPGDTGCAG